MSVTKTMNVISHESKQKKRKFNKLCGKIRNQLEFYFSDSNLAKDKFLSDLISRDTDGFVEIDVFKCFNKMKALTQHCDTDFCSLIATAIERSDMFEVSKDHKRLRRVTPVDMKDFDACTLYVEKLPHHADQKWIHDVFRHFGAIKHVNVPRYKATSKIKGFAFVEFESADSVKNACKFYKLSPEKECSASEDESKNLKNVKRSKNEDVTERKNKKGRTRSISESSDKADILSFQSEPDAPEKNLDKDDLHQVSKRKRKREDSDSDGRSKKPKDSTDVDPSSSVIKSEEPKTEADIKTEDSAFKPKKEPKESKENITEVHDSDMNGSEMEEGKSKRRRRKKHRSNIERPSLRVMSKSEWKTYRNQYLELQRTTMKFIKKQILLETQELKEQEIQVKSMDVSEPKKSFQFVPDVILKVELPNPLKNSAEIKDLVKANAVVAYIDAPVESTEIFIRCHNSDEALAIVKEEKLNQLGKAELLKGDEEKRYWEKIENDRKVKYSAPVPHKKRGRDKLLAKAAKLEEMKNRHIYFED